MRDWNTRDLIATDKRFVWHPFTNMPEWCAPEHEPLVIVEGHGAILRDSEGREYIDGNSSIWTNIHGHNDSRINAAVREQLDRIAHSSFLGATHPAAIELARRIIAFFPTETLTRVFYSDDGSTAIEVALRIAAQFFRMRGEERKAFISFRHGYHGDTAGAAALGAARMFGTNGEEWQFPVWTVNSIEELEKSTAVRREEIAAVVIEPLIQGAAGMQLWRPGTCAAVRAWCDQVGALFIADEVMTGFGRTGKMFAVEHENVIPDLMVLGKGLSGGYLPLAMTLVTEEISSRFDGSIGEGKALAYGHSYSGNALGCAAAKASLEVFEKESVLEKLQPKIEQLSAGLANLRGLPAVNEVRLCGFIAGIELKPANRVDLATKVCLAARERGLLTRPIGNVIVLMPPLCITSEQLTSAIGAIHDSIFEVGSQ